MNCRRAGRFFYPLVWALSVGALFAACASSPGRTVSDKAAEDPVTASPAMPGGSAMPGGPASDTKPTGPAPATGAAEGTAIKKTDPALLSKAQSEKAAIEAALVMGTPSSLKRAEDMAAVSMYLGALDARDLAELSRRMNALVYPLGYPAVGRRGFSPQASAGESTNGREPQAYYAPLLAMLADAAAGRVSHPPSSFVGNVLAELVPALGILAGDSRETARLALNALDRFVQLGAESVLPDLLRGIDAERQGGTEAAAFRYRAVLAKAPEVWPAGLGLGRVLLTQGKSAAALAALEAAKPPSPGSPAFDKAYARALYENGRYDEAAPLVNKALSFDPDDAGLLLIRAALLIRARSYQQAQPLLDAYATVDPSNRRLFLLRIDAAEGLRSRDEALRWARRGLSAHPDDLVLLAAAARLLFAGPDSGFAEARDLALRTYAKGQALGVDAGAENQAAIALAARLLCADCARRDDWGNAAIYLAAARARGPFDDKVLAATVLRKSSSFPEALDYALGWYKASPDDEAAIEAYLRALIRMGEAKTAGDIIVRELGLKRSQAFRSLLFLFQSRLGRSDDAALALIRSALMENADNAEALGAAAEIYMKKKDYQRARFYLRQGLLLLPKDPELQRIQRELDASAGF